MAVGINAIEAILEGNPHLRTLKGFMGFMDQLHEAQEVLQARELAAFARAQYSSPKPSHRQRPQHKELSAESPAAQQQLPRGRGVSAPRPQSSTTCRSGLNSPASCLAAMWSQDEDVFSPSSPVSPVASAPAARRKQRHRRHSSLQPEPNHSSEQQAMVSDVDCTPIASPANSNGNCFLLTAKSSEVKAVCSMDIHPGPVERKDSLTNYVDAFSAEVSECMGKTLIVHPLLEPTKNFSVDTELTPDSLNSVLTCTAESMNDAVGSLSKNGEGDLTGCFCPVLLEQRSLSRTVSSELVQLVKTEP
ncbi:uncharacterized protein LOC113008976 [Astatotilapia calliptera]|uniref:uncharacterized protein LOC113008976 n=1 Tax=Astatotilapia calliptera TaxID=8154 RepID=UPI000E424EE3|nr:uncharacterized protein LOC113008976 [Astatotilapia calliptera]